MAEPVTHQVGTFRAIEVQEDVRVDIVIDANQTVTAQSATGDVSKLRLRQFLPWIVFDRDTRWLIFPKWRDDQIDVSITTPVLNGLKAFDGAQATLTGDADARLWVEAGRGGVVRLDGVEVTELTLVGREDGRIEAAGTCERLTIRGTAAAIDASGLDCQTVVVTATNADLLLPDRGTVVDAHPES